MCFSETTPHPHPTTLLFPFPFPLLYFFFYLFIPPPLIFSIPFSGWAKFCLCLCLVGARKLSRVISISALCCCLRISMCACWYGCGCVQMNSLIRRSSAGWWALASVLDLNLGVLCFLAADKSLLFFPLSPSSDFLKSSFSWWRSRVASRTWSCDDVEVRLIFLSPNILIITRSQHPWSLLWLTISVFKWKDSRKQSSANSFIPVTLSESNSKSVCKFTCITVWQAAEENIEQS